MTTTKKIAQLPKIASPLISHISIGGLETKDASRDIEDAVTKFAADLKIRPEDIRYTTSFNVARGVSQGYGYIWFEDPRFSAALRGLNYDGTPRVKKVKNPEYKAKEETGGTDLVHASGKKKTMAELFAEAADELDEEEARPEFIEETLVALWTFPEHKYNAIQFADHKRIIENTLKMEMYKEQQAADKRSGRKIVHMAPDEVLRTPLSKSGLARLTPTPMNFAIVVTAAMASREEDDDDVVANEIVALRVEKWVTAEMVHNALRHLSNSTKSYPTGQRLAGKPVVVPYPVITIIQPKDGTLNLVKAMFDGQTRDARFALYVAKAVEIKGKKANEKTLLSFNKSKKPKKRH